MEDEACTTFGAGVLGEQEDAGVGALGGGAVAEPGGEGNAEGEFRGDGAHVEDDGAESSRLEEQVGGAEGLVEAGVLAYGQGPLRGKRCRARGTLGRATVR